MPLHMLVLTSALIIAGGNWLASEVHTTSRFQKGLSAAIFIVLLAGLFLLPPDRMVCR